MDDGIDTIGKKITVCQLYAKQNGLRKNVKHGTEKSREYLMGLLQDDPIVMTRYVNTLYYDIWILGYT